LLIWVETKNIYFKIVLCGFAHILKVCLKGVFSLTFGWDLNVKAFYCAIFLSFLDMKNMVSRFNLYHFHYITKIERKTLLHVSMNFEFDEEEKAHNPKLVDANQNWP
jgi:hypothetical protein